MAQLPMQAIECVDRDEAELLLDQAPPGSHLEVIARVNSELIILWVPAVEVESERRAERLRVTQSR